MASSTSDLTESDSEPESQPTLKSLPNPEYNGTTSCFYMLLKDYRYHKCGHLLVKLSNNGYRHFRFSPFLRTDEVLLNPHDVVQLSEQECHILDAIQPPSLRYTKYMSGKLDDWGVKVGDTVLAPLGQGEQYTTAVIRWCGLVNCKYLFGAQITEERYYGCGKTISYFSCPENCGLLLTLAEIKLLQSSKDSEEIFCANIEKHLQRSGAVNRFLGHIMFVGLPGSGKTTLIARLLDLEEVEAMLKASGSTGVMDGIITVDIMEDVASIHAANIGKNCKWLKVEFGLSCLRQMGIGCFVLKSHTHSHNKAVPRIKSSWISHTGELDLHEKLEFLEVDLEETPFEQREQIKQSSIAIIERMLMERNFSDVRPFLENKSSLYLSDTGGQIEFQELIPLLVAGHAIFVFLFPLIAGMDARVTVSYRKKLGDQVEHSNIYESSLTIKESFLYTLASIDSMEGSHNPSTAKHKSYVFVVGTYKDCLVKELGEVGADKRIAEINSRMKSLIKEHKYEDLVIFADKANDQVFFSVDNTCQNDTFLKIRLSIMDLLHSRDEFHVQFPLSYLLASLHLQDSGKPFIRRSDFANDVHKYGIEEEDIDHVLQFLSSRVGQIRYFPLEDIREIIVNEPQALYNLVTYLITKSFISQSITMKEYSEVQRGIYSLESFNVEEFLSQSEFLTPQQLIHLLKELRIVAPFHDRAAGVEKYFIPCVLNHLPESPVEKSCKMSIVQSLAVMFDCGHCPKGIFGVLLHYILTHKEKKLDWYLDINKISRDQVSFEVGPYEDVVTLKFHTTHLEVGYFPVDVAQRGQAFTVRKICIAIRLTLESGIEEATKSLHYSQAKTAHGLGLVCAECSATHKVSEVASQYMMKCPKLGKGYSLIPDSGTLWLGACPSLSFPDLADCICLKEGCDHKVDFTVTSDPSLDTRSNHFLSKEGGSPCEDRIYIQGTTVHFRRVRSCDAGTYTVSTFNAVGKGTASFQLKIKAPPKYSLKTDYLEIEAGSSPILTFTVTSDPPLAEDIEHTLSRRGGGEVTKRFKIEAGCITFRKVRVEDTGMYTISCCNDEGEVGQATLELEVTTPRPPTHQPAQSHEATFTVTLVRSEDVNVLMSQLYTCAFKWREIGSALNFRHHELENISYPNPRAPSQQLLTELLTQWSQRPTKDHPELPTLERLCDALRSGLVGLGAEANSVYQLRHVLSKHQ